MMDLTVLSVLAMGLVMGTQQKIDAGSPAPEFSLMDQDSTVHKLADYKGQNVVVYFYPKDDTPGCTKEACSIRDNYNLFKEHGIKVFGISYDKPKSHKKFADKYQLPFTLLSDSDKDVSRAYGAHGLLVPKRYTYLINTEGIIFQIYQNVDVTTHGGDILAAFKDQLENQKDKQTRTGLDKSNEILD